MMCINPVTIFPRGKKINVPCSKCLACLSNKRIEWAFRLTEEHKNSKSAYFVTLTYDRENLNKCDYELSKKDLQLYLKRLRKHSGVSGIRYYAVGEYGTKTLRPHYHVLLFNAQEACIRKSWAKGIVHVGQVSGASISYCLKYLVQPDVRPSKSKTKSFATMSRGYGLGAHYLSDEMVAWHRSGDKNYAIVNGIQTRLPRFYKEKIWPQRYYLNVDGDKLPLENLEYTDRNRVSQKSQKFARDKQRAEKIWFWQNYGEQANERYKEMRNAVLARIKLKVAFTQTI